jgi:hypothetical protein
MTSRCSSTRSRGISPPFACDQPDANDKGSAAAGAARAMAIWKPRKKGRSRDYRKRIDHLAALHPFPPVSRSHTSPSHKGVVGTVIPRFVGVLCQGISAALATSQTSRLRSESRAELRTEQRYRGAGPQGRRRERFHAAGVQSGRFGRFFLPY